MQDLAQFAEKYQLAVNAALESNPKGGLSGFELEWNLLDSDLRPLLTVGTSFVDGGLWAGSPIFCGLFAGLLPA